MGITRLWIAEDLKDTTSCILHPSEERCQPFLGITLSTALWRYTLEGKPKNIKVNEHMLAHFTRVPKIT